MFTHENQGTQDITSMPAMPSDVEKAWLDGNAFGVNGIPGNFFQNFPDLYEIWLYSNQLTPSSIPNGCFSGIGSSLLDLRLNLNSLTEIRTNQFSGLPNLEKLSLNQNQMTNIEPGKREIER